MNDFIALARSMRERGELFDRKAIYIARSPGRMDLMGGNDDYTGGMVFESTIAEGTWAAAQRRADRTIVLANPQMAEHGWLPRVEIGCDALTDEATVRRWRGAAPRFAGLRTCWGCFIGSAVNFRNKATAVRMCSSHRTCR